MAEGPNPSGQSTSHMDAAWLGPKHPARTCTHPHTQRGAVEASGCRSLRPASFSPKPLQAQTKMITCTATRKYNGTEFPPTAHLRTSRKLNCENPVHEVSALMHVRLAPCAHRDALTWQIQL